MSREALIQTFTVNTTGSQVLSADDSRLTLHIQPDGGAVTVRFIPRTSPPVDPLDNKFITIADQRLYPFEGYGCPNNAVYIAAVSGSVDVSVLTVRS